MNIQEVRKNFESPLKKEDTGEVIFYPADFTFVCPTELEDLAEKYEEFQKIGCDIYSVSCDTHYVHKAWHDASEKNPENPFRHVGGSHGTAGPGF